MSEFAVIILFFGAFGWVAYKAIQNARHMSHSDRHHGQVHSGERRYLPEDQPPNTPLRV